MLANREIVHLTDARLLDLLLDESTPEETRELVEDEMERRAYDESDPSYHPGRCDGPGCGFCEDRNSS